MYQNSLTNYIYNEEIYDSAEWVALRLMFIFAGESGRVRVKRFVDNFALYYQRRIDAGLCIDSPGTLVTTLKDLSSPSVSDFLFDILFKKLQEKGFLEGDLQKGVEFIYLSNNLWTKFTPGDKAQLLAILEEKVEDYFSNKVICPPGAMPIPCIFCMQDKLNIVKENDFAFAVFDIFPAVPGHCLIIPKRHARDVFSLKPEEIGAMLELLKEMKDVLDEKYQPDGYNVGFNVGYAAGQTIMHAHMHCFPRKWGDVDNPRGGMRNIIPNWFKYPKE